MYLHKNKHIQIILPISFRNEKTDVHTVHTVSDYKGELAKHAMKPLLPLGYVYIVCSKHPNINALCP